MRVALFVLLATAVLAQSWTQSCLETGNFITVEWPNTFVDGQAGEGGAVIYVTKKNNMGFIGNGNLHAAVTITIDYDGVKGFSQGNAEDGWFTTPATVASGVLASGILGVIPS
jgi:hypothetical protein